jgi:HlyD family secretion protein
MGTVQPDIEAIAAKAARKSRRGLRLVFWATLSLAVIGGGWYWSTTGSATAPQYLTEPAERRTIVVTVTATGTVEPTNKVEVSSELSGTVRSVEVDYNDRVTKGQVLAHLDTDKLEATVEHARAQVTAAQARVDQAQATLDEANESYDRTVALEHRGTTTREALQAATAARQRAVASLGIATADARVAAADLAMSEADLGKACICSPVDGVVLDRNVEAGQIVASSLQAPVLFTLAEDLRNMELRVDVDEADIGKVNAGDNASFTVEAYQDRTFPAVISSVRYAPETIDGVVTYKAVLSIDNSDLLLRPGMTAVADITVDTVPSALTIPNAALRFSPPSAEETSTGGTGLLGMLFRRPSSSAPLSRDTETADGRRSIWVLMGSQPTEVSIRTGATDGLVTEVLEGDLAEGATVITDTVLAE